MAKTKNSIVSPTPSFASGKDAPKGSTVNGVPGYQKRTSSPRGLQEVTFSKNPAGMPKGKK